MEEDVDAQQPFLHDPSVMESGMSHSKTMRRLLKPTTQSIKLKNLSPCALEMALVRIMWALFRTRASCAQRSPRR